MRIKQIFESATGMGTGSFATVPSAGKAMIRRQPKENIDPADQGEYDREGDMAKDQLYTAAEAAAELRSILDSDENLPEWVQSKITKAMDYLDTARDYMKSQNVSEGSEPTMASLDAVFNEYDFDRLESIWPALEAGDKKEALRQINHYLNRGKNRAWWGDLQALDIRIDMNDVENSQVMWSKPIQQGLDEGLGLRQGKYYLQSIYLDSKMLQDPEGGPMEFDTAEEAYNFYYNLGGNEMDEYAVHVFDQGKLKYVDQDGNAEEIKENKKGVRAVKHTMKAKGTEVSKTRNPVAKNAMATVGGGGFGAHKNKKKAAKQGEVKHKAKEPAYESKLWAALEKRIVR